MKIKAKKFSDPIIVGAIAGTTAAVGKELIARIFVRKHSPVGGIEKAAGLILHSDYILTRGGKAAGFLMDIAVSNIFATALAILHKRKSIKVNPGNGSLVGISLWAAAYGILGKLSAIRTTTPAGAFITASWHAVWGAIAGQMISLLSDREDEPDRELKGRLPELTPIDVNEHEWRPSPVTSSETE